MNIVTPKIELIASTVVDAGTFQLDEDTLDITGNLLDMDIQLGSTDSETLMTWAGRSCYRSFHRPSKATHADADYINRTLFEQGHWSIAEHASATLYFTGVSRAFLAELTRHRHLSFSVRSQRFVDETDCNVVMPPAIRDADPHIRDAWYNDMMHNMFSYESIVRDLDHLPRKQAREAARSALPNAVETQMVVTGNLRAWYNVIELRTAEGVDAEMAEVMTLAKQTLNEVSPVIFPKENERNWS